MSEVLQSPSPGLPGTQIPTQAEGAGYVHRAADDPLSTVGLALLAYGLVQLLSKVIDKIALGRVGGEHRLGGSTAFTDEDRKRLERTCELVASGEQRLQRIAETAATQQKLVGQVLDELRDSGRRHEQLARKLNAVWNRIGSRNDDGR